MINSEFIQEVAIEAITTLISDEDILRTFLDNSGIEIDDLKDAISNKDAQAAVLDYIMQSDDLIVQLCQKLKISHEKLWHLRRELPGCMY